MRVLVIGNGGREHAICWKLRQSPLIKELYAAPGNAGIASVADRVPIGPSDTIELADFAQQLKIDLTVVGPELPLTLGIVDEFQKRGLPIFGPNRLAAELEGSKVFSKEFMRKYGIPTATAQACSSFTECEDYLKEHPYPQVIKADGLAGGKGVAIVANHEEARAYLREVFEGRVFGNAGDRVLIEEYLEGEEISFMAITDGTKIAPLAPAKDYKKAFDGDRGPNSGGMGSHSPAVVLTGETAAEIMRSVVRPTVQGMEAEGRRYSGCLFVGLMLTKDGPKVLEYNCRFGDPETQSQLIRLEDDLLKVFLDVAHGSLSETRLQWKKEAAACVVVAAREYPGDVTKGNEITIDPIDDESVVLFHSGTEMSDGKMYNVAGRVISVCAHAPTLEEALKRAYDAAPKVRFDGARYRQDIGYLALERFRRAAGDAAPAGE
jgi:phosphoribosylamine--glycine ligase